MLYETRSREIQTQTHSLGHRNEASLAEELLYSEIVQMLI